MSHWWSKDGYLWSNYRLSKEEAQHISSFEYKYVNVVSTCDMIAMICEVTVKKKIVVR